MGKGGRFAPELEIGIWGLGDDRLAGRAWCRPHLLA
jgi:hypothetical protein